MGKGRLLLYPLKRNVTNAVNSKLKDDSRSTAYGEQRKRETFKYRGIDFMTLRPDFMT